MLLLLRLGGFAGMSGHVRLDASEFFFEPGNEIACSVFKQNHEAEGEE
jgi:hypothetical protein